MTCPFAWPTHRNNKCEHCGSFVLCTKKALNSISINKELTPAMFVKGPRAKMVTSFGNSLVFSIRKSTAVFWIFLIFGNCGLVSPNPSLPCIYEEMQGAPPYTRKQKNMTFYPHAAPTGVFLNI